MLDDSLHPTDTVSATLALYIFITTVTGYVVSLYWEHTLTPLLFYQRELQLEKGVARLEAEADTYNNTNQLYLRSKLQRQLLKLRQELNEARRMRYGYQCDVTSIFSPLDTSPPLAPTRSDILLSQNSSGWAAHVLPETILITLLVMREYAVYNFPIVIKYLIRFGHMIPVMIWFGNRPNIIQLPEAGLSMIPSSIVSAVLASMSYVVYGIPGTPSVTGDKGRHADVERSSIKAAPHAVSTTVARGGEKGGVYKQHSDCSIFWWFLLCYCTILYVCRVMR